MPTIIGASVGGVVGLCLLAAALHHWKPLRNRVWPSPGPFEASQREEDIRLDINSDFLIDESKMKLGHILGAGGSCVVKKGTLELRGRTVDIAVKMMLFGTRAKEQVEREVVILRNM